MENLHADDVGSHHRFTVATERSPHATAPCGEPRTRGKVRLRNRTPYESCARIERRHRSDTHARARTYGDCIGTARRRPNEEVGQLSRLGVRNWGVGSTDEALATRGDDEWL